MSLRERINTSENFEVEAGIVTPNLFKGSLGIPKSNDFLEEEQQLANGLLKALKSATFQKNLENHKDKLLEKFNLQKVANAYLTK